MGVATVLSVFKGSSLITPQGEFKISQVFPSDKTARKEGYVRYCTSNGTDIYISRHGKRITRLAVVGK
jgi:hypothetical protein